MYLEASFLCFPGFWFRSGLVSVFADNLLWVYSSSFISAANEGFLLLHMIGAKNVNAISERVYIQCTLHHKILFSWSSVTSVTIDGGKYICVLHVKGVFQKQSPEWNCIYILDTVVKARKQIHQTVLAVFFWFSWPKTASKKPMEETTTATSSWQ